jgi:hypothetical protein
MTLKRIFCSGGLAPTNNTTAEGEIRFLSHDRMPRTKGFHIDTKVATIVILFIFVRGNRFGRIELPDTGLAICAIGPSSLALSALFLHFQELL